MIKQKPRINPSIQPGESMGVYRGGINIPMPIIRNAIKSFDGRTVINFIVVIGIAVIIVALGILGTSK